MTRTKSAAFAASFALVLAAVLATMALAASSAYAATNLQPAPISNIADTGSENSYLAKTDSGYLRVCHDEKNVYAENYDSEFNIESRRTIPLELPYWGGFYAGSDAYYLVEGKGNKSESNTAEVVRVIKYDKSWNRIAAASITPDPDIFEGDVGYPFADSNLNMLEKDGKLYIATGHRGYIDEAINQGHQGYLMIRVNTETMEGKIVDSDLEHSFSQHLAADDSGIYVMEQSEGNRCTQVSRLDSSGSRGDPVEVLKYGGERDSVWAVACYASADTIATSSDSVLCLGTSIDQSKYDNVTEKTPHNIYLTLTPKNSFDASSTKTKWLTNYTDGGKSFLGLKLVKVNDNRFLVLWEENADPKDIEGQDLLSGYRLHYKFIDGEGNSLSKTYTAHAPISDCTPIVANGKAVFFASSQVAVDFYSIDLDTGNFTNEKDYRPAGMTSSWSFDGHTLTISGTGTVDAGSTDDSLVRSPLSSTDSWSSGEDCWGPVSYYTVIINIKPGITAIADNEFSDFENMAVINIGKGVKSIGKESFAYSIKHLEVHLPSSLTSIGKDAFWSGLISDTSKHVIKGDIYAPKGSYAYNYFHKKKKSSNKTLKLNAKNITSKYVKSAAKKAHKTNATSVVLGSKAKTICSKAFSCLNSAKTITLGKNVRALKKYAFKGSKAKTIVVNTKKLTKASIKGSLKGSKVKAIKISVGSKKTNKKYAQNYKKMFTKSNCGARVKVS